MILQVEKNQPAPDICVIGLTGRLLMGNESRQVEWSVSELVKTGVKKVVLDLARLDGIDSTGVGIIMMCHAKLQQGGGKLRIAGAKGIVHDTLQMTHLERLIPFFASADEASRDFKIG